MTLDEIHNMSAGDLDTAYALAWNTKDINNLGALANEIGNRRAGLWGFIEGGVGVAMFPLFDAIQAGQGRPTQVDMAQTAITTSAANVAGDIGSVLKFGAFGAGTALVIAAALYAYFVIGVGRK